MMLTHITRRGVLGAGASAGVLALRSARGSSAAANAPLGLDLFVFQAPDGRNSVFAVVVSTIGGRSAPLGPAGFDVHIHTGRKSWTVTGDRPLQTGTVSERHDGRLYAGEVLGCRADGGTKYTAVVLESPLDFMGAGKKLAVWAEVYAEGGTRFRVGNPFVAELLARDRGLSSTYHAVSPVEDRALFTMALAKRVAIMAEAGGSVADPDLHARRLAARLLPDVIPYRPALPVGFNFASQNGRHPVDDTGSVVATVLTGAVAPQKTSAVFQLCEAFPCFRLPNVAA